MKFHRGQKVLCVNDRFRSYCSYPVIKGVVYTISDLYACDCGSSQVTLFEKPFMSTMKCGCGRVAERRQSYYSWRFIPLEYFEKFIGWTEKEKEPEKSIAGTEKDAVTHRCSKTKKTGRPVDHTDQLILSSSALKLKHL